MNSETKSLLKHTLLGLLGGGAITALYEARNAKEDLETEKKYREGIGKNQITIPLSRKNYLKAVGLGKDEQQKKQESKKDVSALSPQELAMLKRTLLRNKTAAAPTEIKEKTTSVSTLSGLRKNSPKKQVQLRNPQGKFAAESTLGKQAFFGEIGSDAKATIHNGLGFIGGATAGMAIVKAVADRIAINRKKEQVAKSRRAYANMINREVNDEDEPFYRKSAAAPDMSVSGRMLGLAGLMGIGTAGLSGLLIYKIMENRRKAQEQAADKDNSKFPSEKTLKFRFA